MYIGKYIKKNGKITHNSLEDKTKYDIFLNKISEGQILDMYIDLASADQSKAQLAKVHACIRELAKESGYTFEEMKLIIKEYAGLEEKSFADCSKSDLMLAIEACIQIGRDNYNINF
jgi:hypothetical protein